MSNSHNHKLNNQLDFLLKVLLFIKLGLLFSNEELKSKLIQIKNNVLEIFDNYFIEEKEDIFADKFEEILKYLSAYKLILLDEDEEILDEENNDYYNFVSLLNNKKLFNELILKKIEVIDIINMLGSFYKKCAKEDVCFIKIKLNSSSL